jgi:transcriptional regulator with XRE-family HTH domain
MNNTASDTRLPPAYYSILTPTTNENSRKILSANLKKHREKIGLSQEKLAENAKISTMMVKDIEGCRTWVSDKTLESLATALKTDTYRLLMPENAFDEEINKTLRHDLENITIKIRKDVDLTLKKALDLWK